LGSGAGWVFALMALGWTGLSQLPSAENLPIDDQGFQLPSSASIQGTGTSGKKAKILLTPEERFFSDPRSVYVNWSFVEPAEAPAFAVRGYAKPSPEQVATALIDGQKLLAPYAPQTAQGVIAIPVSAGDVRGIMLYDVKRRMLVERRIFKLDQLPSVERSWHALDRRKFFISVSLRI
ncbi:MAG: hypothetical protein QM760_05060, partial [Nibricoccus sp.]